MSAAANHCVKKLLAEPPQKGQTISMKPLLIFLFTATALASSPKALDVWGTCYFGYNCTGNPIGLGKTATECRAQGGHSLFARNVNRCFNL